MNNYGGRYEPLDTVEINSEFYRLVRTLGQGNDQSHLPYQTNYFDKPPYGEGQPPILSDQTFTWHLGGLKSRQGIPGTSEYGQNTDGRWAFRLLPSAKINVLTLPSSGISPSSIFEAMGYIWAVCGPRIYRIDPTTNVVTLSSSAGVGGGFNYIMGIKWENDFPIFTTDLGTNSIVKVTAIGSPDTYVQTLDVEAYWLAASSNRLFKITKTGEVKNIITSLDPMVDANWADSVQMGEFTTPTGLLAYERTVFAGKPEGMFGVGDNGFGVKVIGRMAKEITNCYGMQLYDPWVIVPHVRGLYRYVPGNVETIGLERELLNESPLNGRWKQFIADTEWLYGQMYMIDTDETYIMVGREKRGGEAGFSNIIWDTWLYIDGLSKAMYMTGTTLPPKLYFGHGLDIAYVEISNSPGAVAYATSGNRYMPKLKFDDWGNKDFSQVDIVGKNLDANNYWVINYSIDGGAFSALDINGNQMRKNTNGRSSFFLPITAVGREIQYRLDFVYDGSGSPPEINYFEPFASPQAQHMAVHTFNLVLEENIRTGRGTDKRTSLEQLNDLFTLSESPSAVLATGPWGSATRVWVRRPRVIDMIQRGQNRPIFVVEVSIQVRETS